MNAKPKVTILRKVLLILLILVNLLVGSYVLYSRQLKTSASNLIPAEELTTNAIIRERLNNMLAQNQTRQIAAAFLTSASSSCSTGMIVELFKKAAGFSSGEKFVIILPNHFTQQDVKNFKTNFDLNFNVERADDELSQEWLQSATKYEVPGIVIISDNGKITVLQETDKIEKHLAKFD